MSDIRPIYIADPRNFDGTAHDPDLPLYCRRGEEDDAACLLIAHHPDEDGDIVIEPISKPQSAGYSPTKHTLCAPVSITINELYGLADDAEFAALVNALLASDRDGPEAHLAIEEHLRRFDREIVDA